jgi:hypothetical protein
MLNPSFLQAVAHGQPRLPAPNNDHGIVMIHQILPPTGSDVGQIKG